MTETPQPHELVACPDWGKGGSYVIDPATGVRTLVERGGHAGLETEAKPEAAAKSVKKGN